MSFICGENGKLELFCACGWKYNERACVVVETMKKIIRSTSTWDIFFHYVNCILHFHYNLMCVILDILEITNFFLVCLWDGKKSFIVIIITTKCTRRERVRTFSYLHFLSLLHSFLGILQFTICFFSLHFHIVLDTQWKHEIRWNFSSTTLWFFQIFYIFEHFCMLKWKIMKMRLVFLNPDFSSFFWCFKTKNFAGWKHFSLCFLWVETILIKNNSITYRFQLRQSQRFHFPIFSQFTMI